MSRVTLKLKHPITEFELDVDENSLQLLWIPVEERLPDENDVVLITDSLDVGTGYLIHGYGWISPFDDIDMSHVSHWMPLPQPPKENEP